MTQSVIKYPIVKPYLPNRDMYQQSVEGIFNRNWLTNNGPLVQELEQNLAMHLGVEHLLLVANGTLALQVAYAALGIKGKVLTTPFSFAATASSLCWDSIEPVFIDVNEQSLNICAQQCHDYLKNTLTHKKREQGDVSAILGVHVFGNPCEVELLEKIAEQANIKVVYDAAHAFATKYANRSVLHYGDASTLSLHATKLFHSVEGGAIIFKHKADYDKAKQLINFGFNSASYPELVGINAKMSEFHAAMGLNVLTNVEHITAQRALLAATYRAELNGSVSMQQWQEHSDEVGAYMPILLKTEQQLSYVMGELLAEGIQTRRYFYPSLSTVPAYGMNGDTPIANDISNRVLCLPMYTDLQVNDVIHIASVLKQVLSRYNA